MIALDKERHWYRYHHLFAELLQLRLQSVYPDQVKELHLKAAHWFRDNGLPQQAIHHALLSENFEYAAALFEAESEDMWKRGEIATFVKIASSLPGDVLMQFPILNVFLALGILISGEVADLDETKVDQASTSDGQDMISGSAAVYFSILSALKGDTAHGNMMIKRAEEILPKNSSFLPQLQQYGTWIHQYP